jgi:hypothetical protein
METEEPAQVYTIYPLGYRNHLGTCRTKSRTAAWPEILKVVEIEKCREYFYEECKHGMAEVGYVVPRPGPLESPLTVSRTSNKFPMGKLIGQAVARPGPRESFPSGSGKGVTIVQAGTEMGKMPDYFVHRQANRRRKVWERNSMGNGWKNEKLRKNKCFAGPGKILRPGTQRQGRPPARRPPGARPSSRRAPLRRGQDLDMMTEDFSFCIRKMAVSGICQSITLNVMAVPHETLGLITTMEFLPVQFIGYGGGAVGAHKSRAGRYASRLRKKMRSILEFLALYIMTCMHGTGRKIIWTTVNATPSGYWVWNYRCRKVGMDEWKRYILTCIWIGYVLEHV